MHMYTKKPNLGNGYMVIAYIEEMFVVYFEMSLIRIMVCRRAGEWQLEIY